MVFCLPHYWKFGIRQKDKQVMSGPALTHAIKDLTRQLYKVEKQLAKIATSLTAQNKINEPAKKAEDDDTTEPGH